MSMQISGVNNPLEAAKWGKTPLIQKKAAAASKNAMTDEYVERLQEQARKDARQGVGMSQEAIQIQHGQMAKYVSPDRSAPMAQMTQVMHKAAQAQNEDPLLEFLDRLLGHNASKVKRGSGNTITASVSGLAGGCSADLSSGPMHQGAIIYSPDGEMIASYNSDGGWQSLTTQAESRFLRESNQVYMEAYTATRAEIKAAAQRPALQNTASAVDFRV